MSSTSIPPVSGSVKKKSRKPKASAAAKSDATATADSAPPAAVRPLDMRRAVGELSSAEDAHNLVDELFDDVADTASVVAAALAPSSERRVLERLELRCDDARARLHDAIDDVAVWVRPSRNLAIAAREVGAPSGLVAALAFTWRNERLPDPPASVWSGVLRAQMKSWSGFEAAIVSELSEVCRAA